MAEAATEPQPGPSGIRKRSRKAISAVWNYFERCENDITFARCLVCSAKYQHSNNTSNLAKV